MKVDFVSILGVVQAGGVASHARSSPQSVLHFLNALVHGSSGIGRSFGRSRVALGSSLVLLLRY